MSDSSPAKAVADLAGGNPGRGICSGDAVLLADVGNSRIKLALLDEAAAGAAAGGQRLPTIQRRQDLDSRSFRPENLERWLLAAAPGPAVILVASVYEAAATRLEAAVAEISATRHRPIRQRRIRHTDLPLAVSLPEPQRVGIDRLAAAAAANLVKPAAAAAIVVDCGTAATVDMVSAAGGFLGGAWPPSPVAGCRRCRAGLPTKPSPPASGLGFAGRSVGSSPRLEPPSAVTPGRSSPGGGPRPSPMPCPTRLSCPIWSSAASLWQPAGPAAADRVRRDFVPPKPAIILARLRNPFCARIPIPQ
jgi:hypothetical protein